MDTFLKNKFFQFPLIVKGIEDSGLTVEQFILSILIDTSKEKSSAEQLSKSPAELSTSGLKLHEKYTQRSFVVIGDTLPFKESLESLGGKFNANLKGIAPGTKGYVFSNKALDSVKSLLQSSFQSLLQSSFQKPLNLEIKTPEKVNPEEVKTNDNEVKTSTTEVKTNDNEVKTNDNEVKTNDSEVSEEEIVVDIDIDNSFIDSKGNIYTEDGTLIGKKDKIILEDVSHNWVDIHTFEVYDFKTKQKTGKVLTAFKST